METKPSELVGSLLTEEAPQEPAAPTPEPEAVTSESAPEPAQSAVESSEPEAQPAPQTVKDWAKARDIDPKEIYGLLDSQGESLSSLSNKSRDLAQLDVSVTSHEREKAEFAAERLKFQEQAQDWVRLVQQGEDSQEAFERLQASKVEQAQAFERQTLAAIPEWADATAKQADKGKMQEFAARFGAPEGTADALTAPWANLMMRYVLTLEGRFQQALEKVEKAKAKPVPVPKKPSTSAAPPPGLSKEAAALLEGL